MTKSQCPSCGAEIIFQSSISIFTVCKYCLSMLVRHDLNVEFIGKMAILQEDASPLQIGTEGKYQGVHFGLIGRLLVGWESGTWNEWFILFDDGRHGWLSEGQGFYGVQFEIQKVLDLPPVDSLEPGKKVHLDHQIYEVTDIKKAHCVFSEGELPFKAIHNWSCISVDLTGQNEIFSTIEYADGNVKLFTGSYLDFADFNFNLLRELDGWK